MQMGSGAVVQMGSYADGQWCKWAMMQMGRWTVSSDSFSNFQIVSFSNCLVFTPIALNSKPHLLRVPFIIKIFKNICNEKKIPV
jgi:hypothetical protein